MIVCCPWTFSTFNNPPQKKDKKNPAGRKHLVRWCVLYLFNSNVPTQIFKDFYKLSETSGYRTLCDCWAADSVLGAAGVFLSHLYDTDDDI